MITSCDPINPYTQTGTFGVSYNGGYKPDKSLQWIPPDSNIVDGSAEDDFAPPPLMPPSNMLMQTCEGRRYDVRLGGIPKREMQFDDFTESQEIAQVPPPPVVTRVKDPYAVDEGWNLLLVLVALLIILILTLKSS